MAAAPEGMVAAREISAPTVAAAISTPKTSPNGDGDAEDAVTALVAPTAAIAMSVPTTFASKSWVQ